MLTFRGVSEGRIGIELRACNNILGIIFIDLIDEEARRALLIYNLAEDVGGQHPVVIWA